MFTKGRNSGADSSQRFGKTGPAPTGLRRVWHKLTPRRIIKDPIGDRPRRLTMSIGLRDVIRLVPTFEPRWLTLQGAKNAQEKLHPDPTNRKYILTIT